MKRKMFFLMTAVIMMLNMMPAMPVGAAANINNGDYLQMGTYYGAPILWRCVDIDANGPLMLSDKIICLKPFDAKGTNTSGSHGRGYYSNGTQDYYRQNNGSNYWADSNIRDWLNSLASAGNVNWSCGNPPDNSHVWGGYNDYADEAGFLTNFTQGERNAIKEVTQKSLLDGYEYSDSSNTINSDYHRYSYPIGSIVQNYDTAFSEQVTDRMFLPDVKQINAVYNNRSILGSNYYIGEPTAQCVANSEYTSSNLRAGNKWCAWLRSPVASGCSYFVRYVYSDGRGDPACSGTGSGVRPAFYLNLSSSRFTGGSGTIASPYTVHASTSNWGSGTGTGNSVSSAASGTCKLNLTVYENKKDSSSVDDSYVLSEGAEVTTEQNGNKKKTGKNGTVEMTDVLTGNVVIKKNNFATRTLTAEQAHKNPQVYLEKETDRPIICAVYANDGTDILHTDHPVGKLSKDSITLKADIQWCSGTSGKSIMLMQDSRRVNFSGDTLTTVLSDNFDITSTIYIVATDSNGKSTKKKLKFKAATDVLGDWELSFVDSFKGTIPSSVPVIGDAEMSLDIPMIPIDISFDGNKFYGTIGLDLAKYGIEKENGKIDKDKSGFTGLFTNVKNDIKKSKDSWSRKELSKKWKDGISKKKASFGFDADLTVIGFVEGTIDGGKPTVLDGGVIVNPSVEWEWGSQIWLWPPVYWEASIKGEIEALVNIYLQETAKSFTPRGSISGEITLKGGVGLGVSGAFGVSGGAEGKLKAKYDMYQGQPNYFALSGSIGAYAKAFAGPWTIFDKSFPFAEGVIWDYPSTRQNRAQLMNISVYDEAGYEIIHRDYLKEPSEFTANSDTLRLMSVSAESVHTFKTNVYTYPEPEICFFDNGDALAIWLDDNTLRSDINRTSLMYSVCSGGTWSEPAELEADGTADFSPCLYSDGSDAYILWVDTKSIHTESDTMQSVAADWEISSCVYSAASKAFTECQAITSDAYADMMPCVFGDGEGVYAVWLKNSANDLLTKDESISIMTSELSSGVFGAPSVYKAKIYMPDSIAGTVQNGNMHIAYSLNTTGELEDYTKTEIYLDNEKITDDDTEQLKASFDNEGELYWYSQGKIIKYDGGNAKAIFDEEVLIENDRFKIAEGKNGEKAIVFAKPESVRSELYAFFYDAENDTWGNAVRLTELDSEISLFDAAYDDGTLKIMLAKTAVNSESIETDPYGNTDLVLYQITPDHKMSMEDLYYDPEYFCEGNDLELNLTVSNDGEKTLTGLKAKIIKNGNEISETEIENIAPGTKRDIVLIYDLPEEGLQPHDVTVLVYNEEVSESCIFSLTSNDISIENLHYGLSEGNIVINGIIVNRGFTAPADDISVTLRREKDGEAVDTVRLGKGLSRLDTEQFSFTVPYEKNALYYVTTDYDDDNAGNNEDFVKIGDTDSELSICVKEIKPDGESFTVTAFADSSVETAQTARMYFAAFDENGELACISLRDIDIEAFGTSEDVSFTAPGNAVSYKLMLWNSGLQPLAHFAEGGFDLGGLQDAVLE